MASTRAASPAAETFGIFLDSTLEVPVIINADLGVVVVWQVSAGTLSRSPLVRIIIREGPQAGLITRAAVTRLSRRAARVAVSDVAVTRLGALENWSEHIVRPEVLGALSAEIAAVA